MNIQKVWDAFIKENDNPSFVKMAYAVVEQLGGVDEDTILNSLDSCRNANDGYTGFCYLYQTSKFWNENKDAIMENMHELADDLEEYIADLYGKNIQSLAWEFTHKVNREMKKYLHLNDQRMDGNFANLYNDYPRHVTGTFWATDYDGDDYYDLYPAMVARLDAAEDSEQANKDREYLEEWYFEAFGTYNIKYNFSNELEEVHSMMEEDYEEA